MMTGIERIALDTHIPSSLRDQPAGLKHMAFWTTTPERLMLSVAAVAFA
jgi:hypothetical protein